MHWAEANIRKDVCIARSMGFGRVLFQLRSAETVYRHLHHPAKTLNPKQAGLLADWYGWGRADSGQALVYILASNF